MTLTTTVALARPNSKSYRATIPQGIVEFLQLKPGDKVNWDMDVKKGFVKVSKA